MGKPRVILINNCQDCPFCNNNDSCNINDKIHPESGSELPSENVHFMCPIKRYGDGIILFIEGN